MPQDRVDLGAFDDEEPSRVIPPSGEEEQSAQDPPASQPTPAPDPSRASSGRVAQAVTSHAAEVVPPDETDEAFAEMLASQVTPTREAELKALLGRLGKSPNGKCFTCPFLVQDIIDQLDHSGDLTDAETREQIRSRVKTDAAKVLEQAGTTLMYRRPKGIIRLECMCGRAEVEHFDYFIHRAKEEYPDILAMLRRGKKATLKDQREKRGTERNTKAPSEPTPPLQPPKPFTGNLVGLLSKVEQAFRKYVWFSSDAYYVAETLYVSLTHVQPAFDTIGYPWHYSPEAECGKTRILEVAELMARSAVRTSDISASGLVREKTNNPHLTLFIDEVDGIWGKGVDNNEAIRVMLNAGYRRGSFRIRTEKIGKALVNVKYDPFGAKYLSGIGLRIPHTVASRCIPIPMPRKTKAANVAKFRDRDARLELTPIREELTKWASDPHVIPTLTAARPVMPPGLRDRVEDIWESLLAIADMAGGDWPKRARDALQEIHCGKVQADESARLLLLQNVRDAFENGDDGERLPAPRDFIQTTTLLKNLVDRDDAPWGAWWGRDVEAGQLRGPSVKLAGMLKPFGITSTKRRVGNITIRGYERSAFADAWDRYLSHDSPSSRSPDGKRSPHSPQPVTDAEFSDFSGSEQKGSVAISKNAESPSEMPFVSTVATSNAPDKEQTRNETSERPLNGTPTRQEITTDREVAKEPRRMVEKAQEALGGQPVSSTLEPGQSGKVTDVARRVTGSRTPASLEPGNEVASMLRPGTSMPAKRPKVLAASGSAAPDSSKVRSHFDRWNTARVWVKRAATAGQVEDVSVRGAPNQRRVWRERQWELPGIRRSEAGKRGFVR